MMLYEAVQHSAGGERFGLKPARTCCKAQHTLGNQSQANVGHQVLAKLASHLVETANENYSDRRLLPDKDTGQQRTTTTSETQKTPRPSCRYGLRRSLNASKKLEARPMTARTNT